MTRRSEKDFRRQHKLWQAGRDMDLIKKEDEKVISSYSNTRHVLIRFADVREGNGARVGYYKIIKDGKLINTALTKTIALRRAINC